MPYRYGISDKTEEFPSLTLSMWACGTSFFPTLFLILLGFLHQGRQGGKSNDRNTKDDGLSGKEGKEGGDMQHSRDPNQSSMESSGMGCVLCIAWNALALDVCLLAEHPLFLLWIVGQIAQESLHGIPCMSLAPHISTTFSCVLRTAGQTTTSIIPTGLRTTKLACAPSGSKT